MLANQPAFEFIKLDLADCNGIAELFAEHQFERVIHLGAQAGCVIRWITPWLMRIPT